MIAPWKHGGSVLYQRYDCHEDCLKTPERILSEDAANVYIQDLAQLVAVNKKYTGYEFYPIYVCDIAKIKLVEE